MPEVILPDAAIEVFAPGVDGYERFRDNPDADTGVRYLGNLLTAIYPDDQYVRQYFRGPHGGNIDERADQHDRLVTTSKYPVLPLSKMIGADDIFIEGVFGEEALEGPITIDTSGTLRHTGRYHLAFDGLSHALTRSDSLKVHDKLVAHALSIPGTLPGHGCNNARDRKGLITDLAQSVSYFADPDIHPLGVHSLLRVYRGLTEHVANGTFRTTDLPTEQRQDVRATGPDYFRYFQEYTLARLIRIGHPTVDAAIGDIIDSEPVDKRRAITILDATSAPVGSGLGNPRRAADGSIDLGILFLRRVVHGMGGEDTLATVREMEQKTWKAHIAPEVTQALIQIIDTLEN